jgi:hypothetical protein
MRSSRWLALLVLPLFLAACGPTPQQTADIDAVQRSGVPAATYDKMIHDDPLALSDVEALSHAGVNDGVILRYIRNQGTIYTLNSADVVRLRHAGVSQSVIDYMLATARSYYDYPPVYDPWYGPWWGPWYGPGFYGPGVGFDLSFYGHGHGGYHRGGYHH